MRHRFSLAAAAALVLAACSDAPSDGPTGVGPAFSAVTAACEPATIRYTLANLLTDAGSKAYAIPHFNAGQQADAAGNAALARTEYFLVANHVLEKFVRGGTARPKRYESVQAAVEWTVLALYDCAGAELPITPEQLTDLIDDIAAGGVTGDIGVAIVAPGVDFDVLVSSRQFSFRGPGAFWDEAAIVIVRRIPDAGNWSDGVYHEHPPRYNITIQPYTAQANFDDDGDEVNDIDDVVPPSETGPDVTALVSICPGAGHAGDHDEWFVLRRPEPFLGGGFEALPTEPADPDVICDETLPTYPSPTASLGVAQRGLASLRGAASALLGMLGPAPLYAVDGGIGGRVRLASDYVSAMEEEPAPLFLFWRPIGTTAAHPFQPVVSNALTVPTNSITQFAVSFSSTEYTAPPEGAECDLVQLSEGAPFGTYLDQLSTGTATGSSPIQASCGGQDFFVTITVEAPPPPPLIGD